MKIETHPFNDIYGLPSIDANTTKLILGTFPPFQITGNKSPKLDFYYGSTDNKFWELIYEALNIKLEITVDNILRYLRANDFGIIDIIRNCYRKDNSSSADEDLSIIEFQDIIEILEKTKIDTIYTTSELVTKLLKQQIEPLLNRRSLGEKGKRRKKKEIFVPVKLNEFKFEYVELPANIFRTSRQLNIKTLYSPSDQGIRGITKGINSQNLNIDALTYRRNQYMQLLNG